MVRSSFLIKGRCNCEKEVKKKEKSDSRAKQALFIPFLEKVDFEIFGMECEISGLLFPFWARFLKIYDMPCLFSMLS